MIASVLDTDIFSEVARSRNATVMRRAREYLAEHGRLSITVMTVAEVIQGHHRMRRTQRVEEFMRQAESMTVLGLDLESAELAGRIAGDLSGRGQSIGSFDPLIAAIAIRHGRVLVTGNTEHYRRIAALGYPLRLDDWRQPAGAVTP